MREPTPEKSTTDSSWSDLLSGILLDAAKLLAQELELAKIELQEDIRRTKAYIGLFMIGGALATTGLLFLLVMAVFLLNAGTPLPLWACFGIIGGVVFVLGAVFLIAGRMRNAKVDFIPQRSAEAVKEDFEWISPSIKTSKSANRPAPH